MMNSENQEDDQNNSELFNQNNNSNGGKILVLKFLEPMLFVDVNLGNSGNKRIVVYEGDTAENLAASFAREHDLDE